MAMERSRGQHHLLATFLLILLSVAACIAAGDEPPQSTKWDPCDTDFLSYMIGTSCAGNLEHATFHCCEGVVAAVGIGFSNSADTAEVPCLCRVAKHHYLSIMGIDIHSILRMYPICHGALPAGPKTAEACQGRV